MKELKEQLKEMLKNWLQAPDAEIMTDDIAITVISDEITALINDNYVPKDEACKCHSCGEPISWNCERCNHLWQT